MHVAKISERELNSFVCKQKHSQFLQSWEWGEFQTGTGKKVIRLGFNENNKIFFAISLIKNKLLLNFNYFYSPRINIEDLSKGQAEFIFNEIKKIAKEERVLFLRFDLSKNFKFNPECSGLNLKFQKTIHIQPEKTLILDITKSEEELLQNMHKKTRYNIRLAEKKGVTVREARENNFDAWWKIMNETKTRDGFRLHSREHYKNMLKSDIIKLYIAEFQGKIIAGNIIASFGDMAVYVHGASSNQYRNVMAPYLLQWEVIKAVEEQGCKYYDFYGIDKNKWPGVTRFKKGFAGEEIIYPGTFDLVYNKLYYNGYKLLRKIRRLI